MTLTGAIETFNKSRYPSLFEKEIFLKELERQYGISTLIQNFEEVKI